MTITQHISIDLQQPGNAPMIHAVQGEEYTREVKVTLYSGGVAWTPPSGCEVAIRYGKPDGKSGIYDKLPDNKIAWSISSNTITVILAPQMLTVAGIVNAQVEIIVNEKEILSTFHFVVDVEEDASMGAIKSENYTNWKSFWFPQTTGANVGQYVKITKVDSDGHVLAVEAVDAPSGGNGNANCLLTVETITIGEPSEPGNIPVTGIVLDYSNISLDVGDSMMLAASVTPSNATNNAVLWESSDTNIAKVENGLVTAVASGSCTITAKSAENNSIKATCSVAVAAESGGTVYFYTLDVAKKNVKLADGSLVDDNGAFNVTIPYSEGMTVATCQHIGWTNGYPPFVIKSNGSYSKPEYSETGDVIGVEAVNYTATLNGYAGDAVVYANIYIHGATMDTIKTELESHKDLFYYIPGGVENAE